MNFKNIIRILRHPSSWVRCFLTDKGLDLFYRELIDRRDEVKVLSFPDFVNGNFDYAVLELNGIRYRIWVSTLYASLSRITWYESKNPGNLLGDVDLLMPSRTTVFDFMEAFAPAVKKEPEKNLNVKALLRTLRPEEARHDNT